MTVNHANRGMAFERVIDITNQMYENKGIALINKRPTPVKILDRQGARITGRLEKPSTVDYDGTYLGRSIVFEAKSTGELTRFALSNIEDHQYEYLEKAHRHGAISFLLISFAKHRTVYLMPFTALQHYWSKRVPGGRGTQSITITDLDVNAYQANVGRVPIDYLSVVNEIWNLDGSQKAASKA